MNTLLLFGIGAAIANDAYELHMELYQASQSAEVSRAYVQAKSQCEDAIAVWPTGPRAATCEARLEWMRERQDADGSFNTLTRLQTVRDHRYRLDDETAFQQVAELLSNEAQTQTMRAEIQLWLAHEGRRQGMAADRLLEWTHAAWTHRDELPDARAPGEGATGAKEVS